MNYIQATISVKSSVDTITQLFKDTSKETHNSPNYSKCDSWDEIKGQLAIRYNIFHCKVQGFILISKPHIPVLFSFVFVRPLKKIIIQTLKKKKKKLHGISNLITIKYLLNTTSLP